MSSARIFNANLITRGDGHRKRLFQKFYRLNLFFKRVFLKIHHRILYISRSYARQLLFITLHNSLTKQRPENFKASETRESVNYAL